MPLLPRWILVVAAMLLTTACAEGPQGPDFSSASDLADVLRIADAYTGPYETRVENAVESMHFRWDGEDWAQVGGGDPRIETRRIDGIGCFSRIGGSWVWNADENPTTAGLGIATVGIEHLTSSGLRSADATTRRTGDTLAVTLPGVDGVDRGVIHFDDGQLVAIEWFDGKERVASAIYSFDPEPVTRPAGAKEGIDVQC